MATTIFFSAFMSVIIYFFTLSGSMGSVSAWIWAAFLFVVFFQMMRTRKTAPWRGIFQATFAVLFMISFVGMLIDQRGSMWIPPDSFSNGEGLFCHIVIPMVAIPFALTRTIIYPAPIIGAHASVVGMLAIWLIASITLGRGWCSWVCFYGGFEDGVSRIAKKPRLQILSRNKDLRAFQTAFLLFIALASIAAMSAVYCEWFCPFKLTTEYMPVVDIPTLIQTAIFIALFFGLVIALPFLTKKRFQCSALCPFGAFQSIVDKVSGFRVAIDGEKCTGCMKCAAACKFCAIDIETIRDRKGRPERTCAKCGECLSACPQGAIRLEYRFALAKKGSGAAPGGSCAKPVVKTRFGAFVQEMLEPRNVFVFSAFVLSTMISSGFAPDAIHRIMKVFGGGLL